MEATRKLTRVQEAAARASIGAKMLRELGFNRIECTQDRAGIDWSRWHYGTIHVVMWATPEGFDIFEAVTYENSIKATKKGLERAIAEH